ncbi:PREDICTED: AP2/ERF and B3 domain-containing transcription factor At1g50680-like [Camelina sativa]|uniref:AP2/ERF and B3 domain-containing transcription factor At1g50680-like n=1 Tax=Camelina sativa TaxID=90675 RepID=A0ABM0VZ10_CAMSA|nr:PREDICTED: AP2/ERF and B3 domain-containing transcription factor At1g50680-like [Camelina sativa]XP_019091357.1 PREDICTED: AP2/ERF and B3 domain-containing transcription factor At1g50680-like [Camelina sativa]XP_019091358.1 PREDICTED: AP2/ERF and B3 domain-containing transcription factor At1g50680-like [Camelina sativa]XP_019091359.1 PREDICTED: AP2/ERF and B3 domain-containing transcription factor At1g50680-like [Camelina sativa]
MRLDDEPEKAQVVASATKTVAVRGKVKYKGVVQLQNGHWGVQIYTDQKRIWLGTFKSAVEAAMAYDSASIKLGRYDVNSYRNFPRSDVTTHEPEFQDRFTTESLLNMIREGSYQQKFRDFLRSRSKIVGGSKQVVRGEESNKGFSRTELYQKELTPSDVGKLNRLVIPKRYAVNYMPSIRPKEKEEGEIEEGVEIVCYDSELRQWKFRYCYWKSSQSFVITSGWKSFVRKKKLKEKDVISFYTCDVKTLEGQIKHSLMIDVHYSSHNGSVVPEEANMTVHDSSEEGMKTEKFVSSKLKHEETKTEENKGSFLLFGVRIHCS